MFDYAAGKIADYDMVAQVITQAKAVCSDAGAGPASARSILFTIVAVVVGLRPGTDQEREGLDLVDHGERAYNY